jgi:hypothetical protein
LKLEIRGEIDSGENKTKYIQLYFDEIFQGENSSLDVR